MLPAVKNPKKTKQKKGGSIVQETTCKNPKTYFIDFMRYVFWLKNKYLYPYRYSLIMSYAGAGFILLSPECTHTLLVKDSRSKKWGFPKGHREAKDNNDDLATAMRECWEETGLVATDYYVHSDVFRVSKGSQSYLFRYAVLKGDMNRVKIYPGPENEICECRWVSISELVNANQIYDGNKYLRNWVADLKGDVSKKSVYLFKKLCSIRPIFESMCPSNVVTCA